MNLIKKTQSKMRQAFVEAETVVFALGTIFAVMIIPTIVFFLSLWTQRNVEWLISAIKGTETHVSYWLALAITIVFNAVILMFNIIIEIARLFY